MKQEPGVPAPLLDSAGPVDQSALAEYRLDPRRAITETGVICLVCGRLFRHLTNTHLRSHGLTSREYKREFGYNIRRALMIPTARDKHSQNANRSGLAARIRRRQIFEDVELKRMGGRRPHTLEEALTRQERSRRVPMPHPRDMQGRFLAGMSAASLQLGTSEARPMSNYRLTVNGKSVQTGEVAADMPLLWVLRERLNLKGTKFGCGVGACGACTVQLDGQPRRACQTQVSAVGSEAIATVEGLSTDGSHPLQKAWVELDVPQCGYCQAGQLMSASALLARTPNPSDEQITSAMTGNVCRCGTYLRIRRAIHLAASYGRR